MHPSQFEFTLSIMILSAVILGGIGNVYGAIFGALLIGSFDRILADRLTGPLNALGEQIGNGWLANHNVGEDRYLVFGLALVLMMVLRPVASSRASNARPNCSRTATISPFRSSRIFRRRTHNDPTPDEQGGQVR